MKKNKNLKQNLKQKDIHFKKYLEDIKNILVKERLSLLQGANIINIIMAIKKLYRD